MASVSQIRTNIKIEIVIGKFDVSDGADEGRCIVTFGKEYEGFLQKKLLRYVVICGIRFNNYAEWVLTMDCNDISKTPLQILEDVILELDKNFKIKFLNRKPTEL